MDVCNKCNKEKNKSEMRKDRRYCKDCYGLQMKKQLPEQLEEQEESNETLQSDNVTVLESLIGSKLETREDLEDYVAKDMVKDISMLDNLTLLYSELANSAKNARDKKDFAAKTESTTQKKIDLKLKLIKSFDLFSDLAKPESEDPLYTPVSIFIVDHISDDYIIDNQFEPTPDEIQPVAGGMTSDD